MASNTLGSKLVYTIGHSTRSLAELARLLKQYGVVQVVDIRRFPTSRKNPQFRREVLEEYLRQRGFEYLWLGKELGGYRLGGFEEYIKTQEFSKAIDELCVLLEEKPTAIMCSEKLWFRCHRRFISDELVRRGYEVIHIVERDRAYRHKVRERRKSANQEIHRWLAQQPP